MSSLLNFFSWSQPAAAIVAPAAASNQEDPVGPTPAESSDDAFVLIDTPMLVSTPSNSTPSHTRSSSAALDSWSPIDANEPLKLASPVSALSSARSCRLYGAAHKPPRLHPSSLLSTIPGSPISAAASSTPGTKRSFAEIIKSNTPTSEPANASRLAYAQSAQLSVAEQLLAKIEQLESIKSRSSSVYLDHPMTDDIESALESIQYASPPLRPTVPLTREQSRLYDETASWTLDVDEPNSKRAKLTTIVLSKAETQAKLANKKGKSKPAKRQETKALSRARGSKLETDEAQV